MQSTEELQINCTDLSETSEKTPGNNLIKFLCIYSGVKVFHKNFLPLHLPCSKSLKIIVLKAVGNTSEIIIQKIIFMSKEGKSLNHLVKRINLTPKNAMDLFTSSKANSHPSALFVDPTQIVEANIEDYTNVAVEFSRKVQIGAILFEIHRDDISKNMLRVAVYSNQSLVFFVNYS